eukprot:3017824-Amphidinium_carterae.1
MALGMLSSKPSIKLVSREPQHEKKRLVLASLLRSRSALAWALRTCKQHVSHTCRHNFATIALFGLTHPSTARRHVGLLGPCCSHRYTLQFRATPLECSECSSAS